MQFLKTKSSKGPVSANAGFTLIEIIVVIALLGVFGLIGVDFITQMFLGFNLSNTRLEIYNEGKDALVRFERELHAMVPNAICVTNDGGASCLSDGTPGREIRFGMIAENAMRTNNCSGQYVEKSVKFPTGSPAILTEVSSSATPPVNSIISVYNTNWQNFNTGSRLFRLTSRVDNEMTFAGQNIITSSPQRRYYMVDRAISYRWDSSSNILYRSVTSVNESGISSFASATEYPLAMNVESFEFYYMAPSLSSNGIISVVFRMNKGRDNITMHKEIHVKNVP